MDTPPEGIHHLRKDEAAASPSSSRHISLSSASDFDQSDTLLTDAELASELSVVTRALRKPSNGSYCCKDFSGYLVFIPKDTIGSFVDTSSTFGSKSPSTPGGGPSSCFSSRRPSADVSLGGDKSRRWSERTREGAHLFSSGDRGNVEKAGVVFQPGEALFSMESYIPCLFYRWPSSTKLLIHVHSFDEDLGAVASMLKALHRRLRLNVLAMEFPGYGIMSSQDSFVPSPSEHMKEQADRGNSFSLLSAFLSTSDMDPSGAAPDEAGHRKVCRESLASQVFGAPGGGDKRLATEEAQLVRGYESHEDKPPPSPAGTLEESEKGKLLANLRFLLSFVLDTLRVPPQNVFFSANKLAAGPVIELCSFADLLFNGTNSFGGLILIEPLLVPDLGGRSGGNSIDRSLQSTRLSLPVKLSLGSDKGDKERGPPPFVAESFTLSAQTETSSGMPSPAASSVASGPAPLPATRGKGYVKETGATTAADTSSSQREQPEGVDGRRQRGKSPTRGSDGFSQVRRTQFPEQEEDSRSLRRASCSDSSMSTLSHKAGRLARAEGGRTCAGAPSVCSSDVEAAQTHKNAGENCGDEVVALIIGSGDRLGAPRTEQTASGIRKSGHKLQSGRPVEHVHSPFDPDVRLKSGTASTASFSQCDSCSESTPVLDGGCKSDSRSVSFEKQKVEKRSSANIDTYCPLSTEPRMQSDVQNESSLPRTWESQYDALINKDQNASENQRCNISLRFGESRNDRRTTEEHEVSRHSVRGDSAVSKGPTMLTNEQLGSGDQAPPKGKDGAVPAHEMPATGSNDHKAGHPAAVYRGRQPATGSSTSSQRSFVGEDIVTDAESDVTASHRPNSDSHVSSEDTLTDSETDISQDEKEQDDETFISLVRSIGNSWVAPSDSLGDRGQDVPFFSQVKQFLSSSFAGDVTEPEEGGRVAAIAQAAREGSKRLRLERDKKRAQGLPAAFGMKKAAAHIREVSCPLLFMRRELSLHIKPSRTRRREADMSDASFVLASEGEVSTPDTAFTDVTSQSRSETEEDEYVFSKDISSVDSDSSLDSTAEEVSGQPLNSGTQVMPTHVFGGEHLSHKMQQTDGLRGQTMMENLLSARQTQKHQENRERLRQRREERKQEREARRKTRERAAAYVESLSARDRKALKQEEASGERVIKLLSDWARSADKETAVFSFYDTSFYKALSRFINEPPRQNSRRGQVSMNTRRSSLTHESAAELFAKRAQQHLTERRRGSGGHRGSSGQRPDMLEGICIPLRMFEVPPAYRQRDDVRKNSHDSTDSAQGDSWIYKAISTYTSYFDLLGSNSGRE
ncbi:hypothetical protein TGME49_278600 [Toxoplasma gondii ME49]|uniref:Uncharacterized protein n=2 Tax=Toxoplasma gondii TaxID=5811 RepID=A0A125YKP2_TOXGV|nr:hypothetical protein TGME49_278600 [Toxoplasma gondii ME49]EPT25305.1 hypothetical protein TGME49_278600 [Toxoplasma gondii ME49]ESS34623.1 hypothetical protein TGVEG_278600 [Toxoplasma gondii VEG]CEL78756.1 TPA: hypothetical protein BN1205_029210 [Toxoplasma gondii VEG]|eukprot:XP_018635125.1 hypothetical protein TGME49_278600 [Toxoplasma gondii ME49]